MGIGSALRCGEQGEVAAERKEQAAGDGSAGKIRWPPLGDGGVKAQVPSTGPKFVVVFLRRT